MRANLPGHITTYDAFDLVSEAIICINRQGQIIFMNQAASQLTGFTPGTATQNITTIFDNCMFPPDRSADFVELPHHYSFRSGKKTQNVVIGIFTAAKKRIWVSVSTQASVFTIHGEIKELLISLKPFVPIDGRKTGNSLPANDSTKETDDNHSLEIQLAKSNKRYEMAARASFDILWELDIKTDLLYFNPESIRRVFGYKLSSPIPFIQYLELTRHPDTHHLIPAYRRSINQMEGELKEYPAHKIRKADGSTGYVNVKIICQRNEAGEITTVYGTTRDITEKYLAEQEIRKSNERYELAARASFDILWDVDIATCLLTFSNAATTDLYGYDIKNPIPDTDFVKLLVYPDDQEELFSAIRDFIKSSEKQKELPVHRVIKNDGSIAYVVVRVLAIRDADNYVTRIIGVSKDITEQYLAEQEIRKSNERYELIVRTSLDMLWERDFSINRYFFSDALLSIYGYDNKEEWTFEKVQSTLVHPDDQKSIGAFIKECYVRKKETFQCPAHRYVKKDGTVAYVQVHGIIIYDENQEPVRTIGVTRDITEMKKLEEKMAEEEIIHLQQITAVTVETQERERETIGRELHDNINQILASVKLNLEIAIENEGAPNALLEKSYANINEAIREIRIISRSLISPVLDIGITDAIHQLIENINSPLSPKFTYLPGNDDYSTLCKTIQLMAYRIVQEQINNILKHANATEVVIQLGLKNGFFCLHIKDNGIGFDINERYFGVGLRNIKSRVGLYHGKVTLASQPGHGCTLDVCIPVN